MYATYCIQNLHKCNYLQYAFIYRVSIKGVLYISLLSINKLKSKYGLEKTIHY